MLGGATGSRRKRKDGHSGFARWYDGAAKQREVVSGMNNTLWIQIRILGRHAATPFLSGRTRRRRRITTKGNPLEICMRSRFTALSKEMGIFPLLILVQPNATFAVAVNVRKTSGARRLGLGFHDTLDIAVHVTTIDELHKSKLICERGWTHGILGFLTLDDGSRSRGSFGLHFGRGVRTSGFGPASCSKDGERTEASETTRFAGRRGGRGNGDVIGSVWRWGLDREGECGRNGGIWELEEDRSVAERRKIGLEVTDRRGRCKSSSRCRREVEKRCGGGSGRST